ncbi:MAG: ImmA/IrrE family metallo-endopeptidase [Actinobacteria bacterium]|nr:ImmA/IrrE family metallo-endopeptidase [Actinomycetota bacterium]
MKRVIDKANEIYRQYGNDLDEIAESLGLSVISEEMEGRLTEFYVPGMIAVNSSLSSRKQRELIAHAVGHHLMHAGNHLAMQKRIYSFGNYHEKQANVFAACLLMPQSELQKFIANRNRIDEMANHFQVTEGVVRLRLKVWANFERDLSGRSAARAG